MSEENNATFRRYVEEVGNQGNLDLADEISIATSPTSPTVQCSNADPRT